MTTDTAGARADLIDQLLGLPAGHPLLALRQHRDKARAATQGSYDLLFDTGLPGSLSQGDRLLTAWYACRLAGAEALAAHYQARLPRAEGLAAAALSIDARQPDVTGDPRRDAVLAFAHALTLRPRSADRAALAALRDAGLSTPDVVALAQLLAFLSFQIRLLAGLEALRDAPAHPASAPPPFSARPVPAGAVPGARLDIEGYTNATLNWQAWLETLDLAQASPEQLAVLEESHPKAKTSDYYLLLVQQPAVLRQRSIAFNAIMYAPGGLPRAERELGATVASRINGCAYCASVHAQRFEQLAKRNDVIAQVFTEPDGAGTSQREAAVIDLSAALTREPATPPIPTVQALRGAGVDDTGILDLIQSVAIFAWANRLMLNLGAPAGSQESHAR